MSQTASSKCEFNMSSKITWWSSKTKVSSAEKSMCRFTPPEEEVVSDMGAGYLFDAVPDMP